MRNQQVRRDRMYPAGKRMAAQRRRRRKRNLRLGFVLLLFLLCVQQSWTTLAGASPATVIASELCS